MSTNKTERDEALNVGGSETPVLVTTATCAAQAAAQDRDDVTYYYLELDDVNVHCEVPATGSLHIVLPGNVKARGREYDILCVSDLTGTGVTVEDRDDAIASGKNYTTAGSGLTAVGDEVRVKGMGVWYSQTKAVLT